MPLKCMVCGVETKPSVPLNFCEKCRFTSEADKIRAEYREWFKRIVAERGAVHL
jgi:hypothetical protein